MGKCLWVPIKVTWQEAPGERRLFIKNDTKAEIWKESRNTQRELCLCGWDGENNIPRGRNTKHRDPEAKREEGTSHGLETKGNFLQLGQQLGMGWGHVSLEKQRRLDQEDCSPCWVGSRIRPCRARNEEPLAGFNQWQVGIGLACEDNHSGSWVEDQLEEGHVEHLISDLNGESKRSSIN